MRHFEWFTGGGSDRRAADAEPARRTRRTRDATRSRRFAAVVLALLFVLSGITGTVEPTVPTAVAPPTTAPLGDDPALDALTDAAQYDRSTKLARNDYVSQTPPGFEGTRSLDWASMDAPAGAGHEHGRATTFEQLATSAVCPVGTPTKTFDVVAIDVDIPLNRFGDHDPEGRMYVLRENLDDVRAQERIPASDPNKVQIGLKDDAIQPLVVRANLGDCVVVRFENQLRGESASFHVHRGPIGASNDGSNVGNNPSSLVAPGDSRTYTFRIPDDERYEGAWYFHSHGNSREQTDHGLFGSLNVEHRGSTYLHPETREPLASGWEAIVVDGEEGYAYREYTVVYHEVGADVYRPLDKEGRQLPLIDPITGAYRPCAFAVNYRAECWMDRLVLNQDLNEENPRAGPDHDKSLSYNSYTFGDPATPMPRAYVADPSKIVIVHGGGEQFHSHHLHGGGIRWLFEPHADSHSDFSGHDVVRVNADTNERGLEKTQLDPRSESRRLDVESFGPGETFTTEIACGAGGCQRAVGDFLYHCHVPDHYVAGMWGLWRVYNTHQDDLAELPDRVGGVAEAVDSTDLVGVRLPSGTVLTEENVEQWVESNLPAQGVPQGVDASVYDWAKEETADGVLYLSEPEDTRSWANFESETPGERRPIMFDPATGRLAYPWLSPHLGSRPPFAPGNGPAPYLATTPTENVNDWVPQNNDRATMPADPERPDDAICPAGSPIREYDVVAVQAPVQFNDHGDGIDDALVYVLAEDLRNGRVVGNPEPLIIRANVGDCVQLTFVNAIPDGGDFNGGFSKTDIHPHFIQFDPQASDGAINGFNYEQAVRPYASEGRTLTAAAAAGDTTIAVSNTDGLQPGVWVGVGLGTADIELHRVASVDAAAGTVTLTEPVVRGHAAGQAVGVEFLRYAYYVDVDLGNVYFHDHVDGFTSWPRGLFGTLIVEPKDSRWLDPADHSREVRSGAVADIVTDRATVFGADPGSYREIALILTDTHGKGTLDGDVMGTVNLRAEPFENRDSLDPAYALSSVAHGDPATPMLRAYEGDPMYVHVLNGGTWSRFPVRITGHEFVYDHIVDANGDRLNRPQDALQVDMAERFDLWIEDGAGEAGDYLWYVPQADHFEQGMWGIVRVHDTRQPDLQPLPDRTAPPTGAGFPVLGTTGRAPPSPGEPIACPAGAALHSFDVVAMRVDVDGSDIRQAYVLAEDAEAVERGEQPVEPLVLRAATGECIEVTLENRLSERVSLHIGRGTIDPQASQGITVGYNHDQSVAPGESRTYRMFAIHEYTGILADFAQLEGMEGQASGLYGAIVVGPPGTTYVDPATGLPIEAGVQSVAVTPDGAYRDNVLLFHEEDPIFEGPLMPYNTHPQGESLVNYRTEPLTADRLDNPATAFDSDVHGDPATPILEAYAGDPTTVHVIQGYGFQNGVFALDGHGWQRDANVPESTIIGTEKFAPHMVIDAELIGGIDAAGRPVAGAGAPGDYLWSNHRLPYMEAGQWGLFRVHASEQADLLPLSAISYDAIPVEPSAESEDPESPESPTEPTDSTDPAESATPEDPAAPTDPTVPESLENPESLESPAAPTDPAEPTQRTLTIVGTGSTATYTLTVSSDDLAKSTAFGASVDTFDRISADGTTATGRVVTGRDSYAFTGDVRSLQVSAPVDLLLDGEPVAPTDFPLLAHTVTVVGDGTRAFYEFDASGDVVKTLADGGSIQANDVIDGRHVSGTVVGGRNSFAFGGDLTGLSVTGSARVFVDGVEVDPGAFVPATTAGVSALLVPSVAGAAFVSLVRRRTRAE